MLWLRRAAWESYQTLLIDSSLNTGLGRKSSLWTATVLDSSRFVEIRRMKEATTVSTAAARVDD